MLYSIRNAPFIISKSSLIYSSANALFFAIFFLVMYCDNPKNVPGKTLLILAFLGVVIGLIQGLYITYRSYFALHHSFIMSLHFTILIEILMIGSTVAFAFRLVGSPEFRWFAFNTNLVCVILTLLIGMYLESVRLEVWRKTNRWREEIEKYIDYAKRQVDPALTTKPHKMDYRDIFWLAVPLTANIPLLFELYGGGKVNAVFFAAPLGIITFSYINLKTFGPGLTRLLLLRKIEKEVGYRFQNADYEEIQEMRRGFFLAKWLMKDYRPPQAESVADAASEKQVVKKQKK